MSWQTCAYDLGKVLKQNALTSDQYQFFHLFDLYFDSESFIVLGLFLVGIYWLVKHRLSLLMPLVVYLVIYYVYHGASTRSAHRYWTPILPVVFLIAAYGVYSTANLFRRLKWGYIAFILITLMIVGLEIASRYSSTYYIVNTFDTNDMYESYHWVLDKEPRRIYYTDYIPDTDLRIRGFDLQKIPKRWITDDPTFLQQMGSNDVLMIDGRLESQMSAILRQNMILVWSSEKGIGQYIYQK